MDAAEQINVATFVVIFLTATAFALAVGYVLRTVADNAEPQIERTCDPVCERMYMQNDKVFQYYLVEKTTHNAFFVNTSHGPDVVLIRRE